MMTVEAGKNILKISALGDSNIQFNSFTLEESILGVLPKAELVIRCAKDEIKDLNETTITIIDSEGKQQEGIMYVYDINYFKNLCTIKLLGCSPEFTRDVQVTKYSNIKNAVRSLAPNKIISDVESDILNDLEIYQMNETNYKLCTRLLGSWRKNTTFAYCLDGLRMIDLSNYKPCDFDLFSAGGSLEFVTPATLSQPKLYELETEFIDYSDGKDPNHLYVKFDKNLIPVNKEYKDLIANQIYNKKFESMATTVNYKCRFLSQVYPCDGIRIEGNDGDSVSTFKTEDMFISSKVTTFSRQSVEVDYCMKSVNP